MWAGASEDYQEIHYDQDLAKRNGLPQVIVQGQLEFSFLDHFIHRWLGVKGSLRKLGCTFRAINSPGETLTCKGKVVDRFVEDGTHFLTCHVWIENKKGIKTVDGEALVTIP